MKRAVLFLFFLGGMMSSAVQVVFATELRVTGKIVPDACIPVFSHGGIVNYGRVSDVQEATEVLDKKTLSLSVSCTSPSRLAIRLIDNHDSEHVPTMRNISMRYRNKNHVFGLGLQTGGNGGGYLISFEPERTITAPAPSFLESATNINKPQWALTRDNTIRKNVLYSWGADHKAYPGGTLNFQTTLGIQAVVDNSANASSQEALPLNGSATFELLYL